MQLTAKNGKVFKIKNTEYYLGNTVITGSKLIAINGSELATPIKVTEDILEEVDAPIVPEKEEDEDRG